MVVPLLISAVYLPCLHPSVPLLNTSPGHILFLPWHVPILFVLTNNLGLPTVWYSAECEERLI